MTRAGSPRRRRTKPLRLLQFTDLHLCAERSGRVKDVATTETFLRCLEHAREHHWPVDAILLTGDLVQDDARAYLALAAQMSRDATPVHCLPGNHDLPAEMETLLGSPPFDVSPVLRYGDWTLLLLDSSVPGAAHGELTAESLKFLDDALERFADSHVLVVLHHQPVPVGSAWLDSIRLMNGPELLEVVSRHRNPRGILWGHVHQASDGLRDGIAMMSTPSTCFQFVPGRDDFAIDDRPPGYRWLHLYPDGRIESQVVWVAPR
jgi:Icc protein